jgi:hypothetical protein
MKHVDEGRRSFLKCGGVAAASLAAGSSGVAVVRVAPCKTGGYQGREGLQINNLQQV